MEGSAHYNEHPPPSLDFLVLNITEEFSVLYKSTECICISSTVHIIFKVKNYIIGKRRWKIESSINCLMETALKKLACVTASL